MNRSMLSLAALCLSVQLSRAQTVSVASPDKRLQVKIWINEQQQANYSVHYQGAPVLQASRLGLQREDGDFSTGLSLADTPAVTTVTDNYELHNGKRRRIQYKASRRVLQLQNAQRQRMDIIFQVSDDGVAFRYAFPAAPGDTALKHITRELTSFRFAKGDTAWLQPMSDPKTGWEQVNPCYEEHYQQQIPAGAPSSTKSGWVFPALFKSGAAWALITESDVDGQYCAARLQNKPGDPEYAITFPGALEVFPGGPSRPQARLPWQTPWRLIAVGSLAAITESTLGTDLSPAAPAGDYSYARPGKASWSWALLKDNSIIYPIQKRFIDYAADMHWEYCLVDVNWDTQIAADSLRMLIDYARQKNVGVWLWYNSAGSWNTTPYHPRNKLLTHEGREAEFARLQQLGVAGVKIDFFGGDGQSMMQYYMDILKDAAAHRLMVNFHGATLPRGWQRTWPNLMTAEAIKGFEYVTFEQQNADLEATHCAMLPFTRNAFDPMDFTPMSLYRIPNIQRRTSAAFELALSVLFLSGVQHFAETPEGMQQMPGFVKEFLQTLPSSWEDVRFIDGFPGRYVVLARKAGGKWYITGINAQGAALPLQLDLSWCRGRQYTLLTGANDGTYFKKQVSNGHGPVKITLGPNDGFVAVVE